MDVELRAVMHQDASGTSSCSVTAWLGTLDLLGWGLEVEKMIYLQYVVDQDLRQGRAGAHPALL